MIFAVIIGSVLLFCLWKFAASALDLVMALLRAPLFVIVILVLVVYVLHHVSLASAPAVPKAAAYVADPAQSSVTEIAACVDAQPTADRDGMHIGTMCQQDDGSMLLVPDSRALGGK